MASSTWRFRWAPGVRAPFGRRGSFLKRTRPQLATGCSCLRFRNTQLRRNPAGSMRATAFTIIVVLTFVIGDRLTPHAQRPAPRLMPMEGQTHIADRLYWEAMDPRKASDIGLFDYARAREGGANVLFENVGTYGYEDYDGTVKQAARLIET